MTWNELIAYNYSYYETGFYEKVYSLYKIKSVSSSTLSWVGEGVVKYKINNGEWILATNGMSLFNVGDDLENTLLGIRVELTGDGTTTSTIIPTLSIVQDEDIFFYGIVGIPSSPTWNTIFTEHHYDLTVQSINALLNRTVVVEAYQMLTVKELLTSLFNNYISEEGITLGGISDFNVYYDVYTIKYKYISDVLDEIAEQVGGIWHVDFKKRFYFIKKDDMTMIDAPTHIRNIKSIVNGIDKRNVQIVVGVKDKTEEQTELFTYDSNASILTNYNVYSIPTIYINDVEATVGIRGIEDDDINKTFFFTTGSQSITVNQNATIKPVDNDIIKIVYIGQFNIVIERDNQTNIDYMKTRTLSSGRIEKVATDIEFDSKNDAVNYASNLLTQFQDNDETITLYCDSLDHTDLLTIWNFNLPTFNIVGEYVITGREFGKQGECKYDVKLTLKDKNYWIKHGGIFNKYSKNIRRLSVGNNDIVLKSIPKYDTINTNDEFRQANVLYTEDGSQLLYLYDTIQW